MATDTRMTKGQAVATIVALSAICWAALALGARTVWITIF
jgi:hypothetical protein